MPSKSGGRGGGGGKSGVKARQQPSSKKQKKQRQEVPALQAEAKEFVPSVVASAPSLKATTSALALVKSGGGGSGGPSKGGGGANAERSAPRAKQGGGGGGDADSEGDDGGGSALTVAPGPTETEEDDSAYPPFEGDTDSDEFRAYAAEKKKAMRRRQKQQSNARAKKKSLALIAAHRLAAGAWLPLPVAGLPDPVVGTTYSSRWECEQLGRGHAAKLGLRHGVTVTKNHEKLAVRCRTRACKGRLEFNYQPKNVSWKLGVVGGHLNACFSLSTPADGAAAEEQCRSAYTPEQVSRLVLGDVSSNQGISGPTIRNLVLSRGIFSRHPNPRLFYATKKAALLKIDRGQPSKKVKIRK